MRPIRTPFRFNPARYDALRLQKMQQGAELMHRAQLALQQRGHTVLSKVGPKDGEFSLWDPYPANKVIDSAQRYQYYYHSHRHTPREHGHFHLYSLLPADDKPSSHLLAIGISPQGMPTGIFSTNLWVSDGYWLPAAEILARLDDFAIVNARPWAQVSRWLTGLVQLFWPQIETLLFARDAQAQVWSGGDWASFWQDQSVEVINYLPLDVHQQTRLLDGARAGYLAK